MGYPQTFIPVAVFRTAHQSDERSWVIIDFRGKGGRIRTVAVPIWVKQGIEAWTAAAKIDKGRLLLPLSKSGKIVGDELGDWAIWSVVEQSSKQIGIEHFGAHDLRRTCAKLCRKRGGDLEQIKFLLGLPAPRRPFHNPKLSFTAIAISCSDPR